MPQRALELFRQLRSNQTRLVAMKWVGANGFEQLFSKMEAEYRVANRVPEQAENDGDEEPEQEEQEEQASERRGKRASLSDELDDGMSNHASESAVKKARAGPMQQKNGSGGKAANPFSAKASMRRSSSGGVLEQLARIEGKTKK